MTPRIGQKGASSLFFLAVGVAALILGQDMQIGTSADMGVGYVPRMLAIGSILIGLWLAFEAVILDARREPIGFAFKPALIVTLLVVAFGVLLPWLGLPLTIVVLVFGSVFSGEVFDWRLLVLTAALLATVSIVLFHWLLRLQVPMWPQIAWPG